MIKVLYIFVSLTKRDLKQITLRTNEYLIYLNAEMSQKVIINIYLIVTTE